MDDKRTGLAAVVRWPDVHPGAWNTGRHMGPELVRDFVLHELRTRRSG
jgi:hypothetical protein